MSTQFLTGPAGTGKTTAAVEQLRRLLLRHTPGSSILVIVPQLTLAQPYRRLLQEPTLPGAATVEVLTLNGLAHKIIDLFWPLGAVAADFGRPHDRPIFLTIETAQYYLHQALAPLLRQGFFDPGVVPLTISLPRLMSQILDNLNKSALIGLPHSQVTNRLAAALAPEPANRAALEHTQQAVTHFRRYCLARNLLDFSLRIETFYSHLWPVEGVQQFLTSRYRHLIVDNIEEDTPFAHTILSQWLPHTDSALLVYDQDAGFRIFLGANWRTAAALAQQCRAVTHRSDSHVANDDMLALGEGLAGLLHHPDAARQLSGQVSSDVAQSTPPERPQADPRRVMTFEQTRFYPQMVEWVVNKTAALIEEGVSPGQIVVLAPFVSDALRFAFTHQMEQRGLHVRSHRPSRPLSEEPAAKTMLTLARLAFPGWQLLPEPFDVAQALHQAIGGLDLIRANLLAQVVYRRAHADQPEALLTTFEQIEGEVRQRITYEVGQRFDRLRGWLLAVQSGKPPVLDHFFSRLFGEVLSQPGFGFHADQEAGQVVANLVDSARQFRRVTEQTPLEANSDVLPTVDQLNRAYLETIIAGIAAAQYVRGWEVGSGADEENSVLITPATTFLMSNRPVDYQFWLDAGSSGWWERIAQPLTHPYVLAADWSPDRPWNDADEVAAQHDRLARLVLGLTRRCRQHIFIVNAEISEQGYEQRGQLLATLQRLLRRLHGQEHQES